MLDWDQLRYFLAIARGGTLSAAARTLKVAQPTVGRRIDAFERQLGAKLFQRLPAGYRLTAAGTHLLAHAERMEREAFAAEAAVAGRDAGLSGLVRITASEWMVASVIGPMLAPLVAGQRALSLELVSDPRHLSLVRREADIALRPIEFEHGTVVQRKVGRIGFGLYASDAYLTAHGAPDFARQAAGQVLIAMTEDVGDAGRDWLAATCANARIAVRTNGREAMRTMVEAGIGLALLPCIVGDALPGVRAVAAPAPPERPLWMGIHKDARALPRVREVSAFLARGLRRLEASLGPRAP
jgi:DNA-binding transcriptional LysR family regulator